MPRPQKHRMVDNPPLYNGFKPIGKAARDLKEIGLSLDEYEALRLADYLGMSQLEASEEMEISRPTFTRLIEKARKKLVEFIMGGHMLKIGGGNIHFKSNVILCSNCGHRFIIEFENKITECPECGSSSLVNYAGGFGHGKCCAINNNNRRRKNAGFKQKRP